MVQVATLLSTTAFALQHETAHRITHTSALISQVPVVFTQVTSSHRAFQITQGPLKLLVKQIYPSTKQFDVVAATDKHTSMNGRCGLSFGARAHSNMNITQPSATSRPSAAL